MPSPTSAEAMAHRCGHATLKKSGWWTARCPAHDDHEPSLHLRDGDKGVVFWCASQRCDKKAILDALGMTWADVLPQDAPHAPKFARSPHATYPYQDAEGNLLFEVVRIQEANGKKTFRQRSAAQKALGKWGRGDEPDVLYHLPRLADAQTVYMVEGEKDVHTLEAWGLCATTNPGGAGKWKDALSEALRDKDVVLLPDNDQPGREHMVSVARALRGIARSVRLVTLPVTGAKEDVSDWAGHGGTRTALEALARETPIATTPTDATPTPEWSLHEVDLEALKDAPPTEWLWWPYMAKGTIVLVDGEPGTGKSLFTMQMAASLTRGYPLPDQQGVPGDSRPPQHVVVFNVEDSPAKTILPRFLRSGGDPQYLHIIDGKMRGLDDGDIQPFTLADVALLDTYLTHLRHPCAMVVIDPLQAYMGAKVDMHRANETRAVMTPLRAVAEKHNAVMLCVRHPAKGTTGSLAIHRGLGSIDIVGIARSALFIERFPGRDGEKKCWLMQTKNNLERIGRTQTFSKEDGLFSWIGVSRLTAEDIAGGTRGPDPAAFLEACSWLEEHLTERFEFTKDVEEQAEQAGVGKRTLDRARRALRVEARKMPQGEWTIRLAPLDIVKPTGAELPPQEYGDVPF